MFILTKEEAIEAVIRFTGSFDVFGPVKYFSGRRDVGTLGVFSHTDNEGIAPFFVVVWKNERGIHCKKEVVPKAGVVFMTRLVFKNDQEGIFDVELKQVDERSEVKLLN